jgi:hypothetical protein
MGIERVRDLLISRLKQPLGNQYRIVVTPRRRDIASLNDIKERVITNEI